MDKYILQKLLLFFSVLLTAVVACDFSVNVTPASEPPTAKTTPILVGESATPTPEVFISLTQAIPATAFTTVVTKNLKEAFERHNLKVSASQTKADVRATNEWSFSIVTSMLLALSVIVTIVGAIALMGVLSIGVIERTKEIGVLRAMGARSRTILGIFVMEGVLQRMISWIVAVPISIMVSPSVASVLGQVMFSATLDYQYNWEAVLTWLGVIVSISILASILPARGATRISVRESLAYA